ncbi:alpha-glycosidase, partial [Enterococcus cecorum]|nr:alpha-glycosidase [Enterococcus cecorum]
AFGKELPTNVSGGFFELLAVDDRTGIVSLARQLEDRLLVATFNTGDQPVTMPVSERTVLSQNTQENQILPKGFVITYWEGVE